MSGQEVARTALEHRKLIGQYFREFWPVEANISKGLCRDIREAMSLSTLVIWEKDIYPIAVRGYEQFEGSHLTERMTKRDVEFWYFNGFKPLVGQTSAGLGVLFVPMPDESLWFILFKKKVDGDFGVVYRQVKIGQQITPEVSRIVAMREFLEQRLAANEPVILPRSERRLLKKQNNAPLEIRLISLRARESSGWHTAQSREYRHRWIQSGHWRRLQEPLKRDSKRSGGKQGDEVVWVIPHEKGPIGAPLLQQRPTAYVVAR